MQPYTYNNKELFLLTLESKKQPSKHSVMGKNQLKKQWKEEKEHIHWVG